MFNRKERRLISQKLKGRFDQREVQKKYRQSKLIYFVPVRLLFLDKFERKRRQEEKLISSCLNFKEFDEISGSQPESDNHHHQPPSTSGNTNIVAQSLCYFISSHRSHRSH